jgi:hypothetical protein
MRTSAPIVSAPSMTGSPRRKTVVPLDSGTIPVAGRRPEVAASTTLTAERGPPPRPAGLRPRS